MITTSVPRVTCSNVGSGRTGGEPAAVIVRYELVATVVIEPAVFVVGEVHGGGGSGRQREAVAGDGQVVGVLPGEFVP